MGIPALDESIFPEYPVARLARSDVIAYLSPRLAKGWEIYRGTGEYQFIVRLADNLKLFIELVDGKWRVSTGLGVNQSLAIWAYPDNVRELDSAIARGLKSAGIDWASAPSAVRLSAPEPATNLGRIVALVGSSKIEAVFDAYLDNKGLDTLLNMVTLGVQISPNVRLVTSTRMVAPSSGHARLTASYARNWFGQLGLIGASIRHHPYSGHQRRFILLSGGQTLIVGPSLNNLALNEACHLEPDTADLGFFDQEWTTAQQLAV